MKKKYEKTNYYTTNKQKSSKIPKHLKQFRSSGDNGGGGVGEGCFGCGTIATAADEVVIVVFFAHL